jgi:uncharacterized membrane protein
MTESQGITLKTSIRTRLPAVDAMRGIVMVLMTLDHASHAFNAGRYAADSATWYQPGAEIPAAQFLTRWVTHLCAPTFLFLAGFVLALSAWSAALTAIFSNAGFSFCCWIPFG